MRTATSYDLARQAAKDVGLNTWMTTVYLQYVTHRFPQADYGYLREWAERFDTGSAWVQSDLSGRGLLVKLVGPSAEQL